MSCKEHPENPLCLCTLSNALAEEEDGDGYFVRKHSYPHMYRKRRRHDSVDCASNRQRHGHEWRMTQSAIFPSGLHHSGRISKKRMSMDDTVLASASHRTKKKLHKSTPRSSRPSSTSSTTTSRVDRPTLRHPVIASKRKRRSRSLSAVEPVSPKLPETAVQDALSRSVSFKSNSTANCRVFNPNDLQTLETIGSGFFGEVFKVRYIVNGEVMVMKRLKMERINHSTKCSFLKEATVMRNLNHYNLLKFMGVMFIDQQLHIITEFIGGGSLSSLLPPYAQEDISWCRKISIARDIACGMTYLHCMNVIHRDLNCGNVLIRSEDGSAVVADFGLSRLITYPKGSRKRRYTVVGHPYWMAPEMMKETDYDERVDVFSFGICLCQLVVGVATADPNSDIPRTEDIGVDADKLMHRVHESCPSFLLQLALRCASIDPESRPPFKRCLEELECELEKDSSFGETSAICYTVSADGLNHLSSIEECMDSPCGSLPCGSLPARKLSFSNCPSTTIVHSFKPMLSSDTQDSGHFSSGGSLP